MMSSDLIHDRGRGPEIAGTRITVYNLLSSFLDPTVTEEEICRVYDLTAQQVAAARAYVLNNPESVLAEHLRIEEKMATGNPPQVREQAEKTKTTFQSFKRWLAERQAANGKEEGVQEKPGPFPTFREWLPRKRPIRFREDCIVILRMRSFFDITPPCPRGKEVSSFALPLSGREPPGNAAAQV
jgi:uncharacterized protein (DUF433 family)